MTTYSERLYPSPWALLSAGLLGSSFGLIAVPFSTSAAIIIALVLGIGIPLLMWLASPVVSVRRSGDGPTGMELTYGHAHIDLGYLGEVTVLDKEAMHDRIGLHSRSTDFVGHSAFIPTGIAVDNKDPDDAITSWIIATRAPDKLQAALYDAHSAHTS